MLGSRWTSLADTALETDDLVSGAEYLPYTLWITDERGLLLDIEDRWYVLTGLDKAESLGTGWLAACHPDDRVRVERAAYRSITTGRPFDLQYRIRFADGAFCWVHSRARPSRNQAGEIRRWYGATEQIDKLVKAQAKRHKLGIELEHSTRTAAINQISGAIAHELSQPLAAAGSFLEGCERALLDAPRHGDDRILFGLTRARDQVALASAIVSRLRRFIQRKQPQAEAISVNEAVRDALALATAGDVQQLELGTQVELDPARPFIMADKVEIQQLIFNLVRNAIEAMEQSAYRQLRIVTSARPHNVEIQVIDTGTGLTVDPDDLFEPFITTKINGLGLGLAICRTIVERRGGQIFARNEQACGASFTVVLPRADAQPANDSH